MISLPVGGILYPVLQTLHDPFPNSWHSSLPYEGFTDGITYRGCPPPTKDNFCIPSSGYLSYPSTHKFIYSFIQMSHFLVLGSRGVLMNETVVATSLRDYIARQETAIHISPQFPSVDILPVFSKCYLFARIFSKHSSGIQLSYLFCVSP